MSSYYYNELPTTGIDDGTAMVLGLVFLGIMGLILLCCLIGWILGSIGLYRVAKRRGIAHAWLAWVPIGCHWILGSVSDQYQHLVLGKVTSRRKILLILNLASCVLGIVYTVMTGVAGVLMGENSVGGVLLTMGLPYLLCLGTSIATIVFYHICNYDFYCSCKPKSAVVFLVLGIIFAVCQPFFYFSCRNKDLGFVIPKPAVPEPAELPQADTEF